MMLHATQEMKRIEKLLEEATEEKEIIKLREELKKELLRQEAEELKDCPFVH